MRTEIPVVVLDPTTSLPVSGAGVVVLDRVSGSTVTIYQTEGGGSTRSQPLSTDSSGRVNGWVERGGYEIQVTISGHPPYSEWYESAPGRDGGIDTNWLADEAVTSAKIADGTLATGDFANGAVTSAKIADGTIVSGDIADGTITGTDIASATITGANLAGGAVTAPALASNVVPLGTIIDWWRATSATAIPTGWAVCDGRAWNIVTNDMGLSSGNMPNLINKVSVGARPTINSDGSGGAADGQNGSNGTAYTNAPGVGGTGGSMASVNLQHAHTVTVPAHYHTVVSVTVAGGGGHNHGGFTVGGMTANNPHAHLVNIGAGWPAATAFPGHGVVDNTSLGGTSSTDINHEHQISSQDDHSHGLGGNAGNVAGSNGDSGFSASAVSNSLSATQDIRPAYVGVLKLMKVRNV